MFAQILAIWALFREIKSQTQRPKYFDFGLQHLADAGGLCAPRRAGGTWRDNCPVMRTWSKAARIAFALTCMSAASERVFSMVDAVMPCSDATRDQASTLADQIQAGVMLHYNKQALSGLDMYVWCERVYISSHNFRILMCPFRLRATSQIIAIF